MMMMVSNKKPVGIKLTEWVLNKLRQRKRDTGEAYGPYLERLAIEDNGWVPPDEVMGDEAGRKPDENL
jgi:hypothetical protein